MGAPHLSGLQLFLNLLKTGLQLDEILYNREYMMKNNPEVNELIDIFEKANNEMLNKELELFIISKVSERTLCGALILRCMN